MLNIFINNTANSDRSKFIFGLLVVLTVTSGLALTVIQPGFMLTDGGIFSAVAFKDYQGGKLYIDAWENKPAGIFYWIELFFVLIPNPVYAVFVMAMTAFWVSAICIYALLTKFLQSHTASLLLSLVSIYFMLFANNIGDGLYTEIYGCMFLLIAITIAETSMIKNTIYKYILSGFALGCSFWFKEPFLLICFPLFVIYLIQIKDKKLIAYYFLGAVLPSILISSILFFSGSFQAFWDTLLYNFKYLSSDQGTELSVKLSDFYKNLFSPILGLLMVFILCLYHNLSHRLTRIESLLWLMVLLSSAAFVILSPYNFGHYYFPSFVFFFISLGKLYELRNSLKLQNLKWILILVCLYSFYRIDETKRPVFTFKVIPFQSNRIIDFLKEQKGKTLFVEYVVKGDYYIKSGLLYPTFVPVGLPIHFTENQSGIQNRERIWKNLSQTPPDYLLTTKSSTYFSWFLPEVGFYENHFERIDSIQPVNEEILYLWKRKTTATRLSD